MFEIGIGKQGEITVAGRLDAAQAEKAQSFLDAIDGSAVMDCAGLEYISSAGLGVLLRTQKRLMSGGGAIKLINVNPHIHNIFRYSGFDHIFELETAAG
jgi:anti-anti-sigma factor